MTIRTKPPRPKPEVRQHFSVIKKIGFRDRVKCPCGAECIRDGAGFQSWIREHAECEPKQEEQ